MPPVSSKRKTGRVPTTAVWPDQWGWFSHAPLLGACLARERLEVVAWDDANHLYVLSLTGKILAETQLDAPIRCVAAADTLERIVVVLANGEVRWFTRGIEPAAVTTTRGEPVGVAIDPVGEYAVVSCASHRLVVSDVTGKVISSTEASAAYRHLAFVPETGRIVGAAEQGLFACHDLRGNVIWKETMYSTVGGIDVTDAGELMLATFSYGVLRYSDTGRRAGSYQLDRTSKLVSVDHAGTRVVIATSDGYLDTLDRDGKLLAEIPVGRSIVSLAVDALARFVVMGFSTGEVRLSSWDHILASAKSTGESGSEEEPSPGSAALGSAWSLPAVASDDESLSALLEGVGSAGHVALYSATKTLRIVDASGSQVFESEKIDGNGRALKSADGWVTACTDRRLVGYDLASGTFHRATSDLYDISHLLPLTKPFDAVIVESCDQILRLLMPSEVLWKIRLPERASSVAVDSEARTALVFENHQLVVLDPQGKLLGKFRPRQPVPMMVMDRTGGWASVSRGDSMLRRHTLDGQEIALDPLPWEPWSILRVQSHLVVTASDGRSLLLNDAGEIVATSDERREGARYFPLKDGTLARIYRVGSSLNVTTFSGRLIWRHQFDEAPAAFVGFPEGVVVLLRRLLLSYRFAAPADGRAK